MFANALSNCNMETGKHNKGINADTYCWTNPQDVSYKGKKLAEDIRNEIEILGGKQKVFRLYSSEKYASLTYKEYVSEIYKNVDNIFIVRPEMDRRFESLRMCLWNPIFVSIQRRMYLERFKTIAVPQPSIENQIETLIFDFKMLSIPYRQNLIGTLIALFHAAKEEVPTIPDTSLASLSNFYYFLQLHPNIKYPAISLTPDYDVYVSWRDKKNRVFSLHFMSAKNVSFVVFKPNDKHPAQRDRISGVTTTDVLLETVESLGIWDWISNDE